MTSLSSVQHALRLISVFLRIQQRKCSIHFSSYVSSGALISLRSVIHMASGDRGAAKWLDVICGIGSASVRSV